MVCLAACQTHGGGYLHAGDPRSRDVVGPEAELRAFNDRRDSYQLASQRHSQCQSTSNAALTLHRTRAAGQRIAHPHPPPCRFGQCWSCRHGKRLCRVPRLLLVRGWWPQGIAHQPFLLLHHHPVQRVHHPLRDSCPCPGSLGAADCRSRFTTRPILEQGRSYAGRSS